MLTTRLTHPDQLETWAEICNLCGSPSDLELFISLTEDEQHRTGASHLGIRVCASCATTPGITDQISALVHFVVFGNGERRGENQ
jgi:hypothetical protein